MANNSTGKRGFGSMDENRQREIASQGGRAQGRDSNAGNFANDPDRARESGRKGGQNSRGSTSGMSGESEDTM